MAAFKSFLDFCEPQVNKCSTGLPPTVAVPARTCFLAILFVSRLKGTFWYPLTTEAILSVFLGRMDSAAENQLKRVVANPYAFRAGTFPKMVPYYIPGCLNAFFGLYASHFVHYIQ